MEETDLQKIINDLESTNSKDEAYFGVFMYGGGPEESYVKANRQGLELFAAELLKASRDTEKILESDEESIALLAHDDDWVDDDSHVFLEYVEPSTKVREEAKAELEADSWQDKLFMVGCSAILIMTIIATLVGIGTIVDWIF